MLGNIGHPEGMEGRDCSVVPTTPPLWASYSLCSGQVGALVCLLLQDPVLHSQKLLCPSMFTGVIVLTSRGLCEGGVWCAAQARRRRERIMGSPPEWGSWAGMHWEGGGGRASGLKDPAGCGLPQERDIMERRQSWGQG